MAIRIQWNEHEEAVLLDALIKVLNHEIDRKQAIVNVSKQLREFATTKGIVIDDKFRNENGIALQMSKLEYVFTNGKSGLRVDTGWYFSIVKTYRENHSKYMRLVGETMEESAPSKIEKMSFYDWLRKNNPEQGEKIIATLIVLGNQRHSDILKITNMQEIDSLKTRVASKRGGRKKKYITALNEYKDYLLYLQNDNAETGRNEHSSIEIEEKITYSHNRAGDTAQIVRFTKDQNYSYTRPFDLYYSGNHYSVKNWTQMYVLLVRCLFEDYPDRIVSLKNKSIRGGGRIDISDSSGLDKMIAPREITRDIYLETNESAGDIVEKSGLLLKLCGIDYTDVSISYTSKKEGRKESVPSNAVNVQRKAKEQYQTTELSFSDWLRQVQGMASGTIHSYDSAINTADTYAREHNIGNGMLRGVADYTLVAETADALFRSADFVEINKRQHNRFRAALRKYLEYVSSSSVISETQISPRFEKRFEGMDFTPYREILLKKFSRGFRIDSRLDMGRFRNFWKEIHGSEILEDDETIRDRVSHITIRYQDFVYLPKMMMSEETKERMLVYLDECFKNGRTAVYFDALYKEFQAEFSSKHINNPDMLKSYFSFINNGRYYIYKNYVTVETGVEVNPTEEVRNYMITIGIPVTVDDLKEALSHIDGNTVFWVVAGHNSAEFVRNQKGEYFHADIIQFTQWEIDAITDLIQQSINDKGYMGGKELTDAIEVRVTTIMERYPFLTWLGLRDIIAYKLCDVFSFRGKIISAYGEEMSMSDVFAHYAKAHDHFTLEQLNLLKKDLDTSIYFDDVYANSLRINQNDFVSRTYASFDIEATDNAISRFCIGDYIPLSAISFFGSFPDAGYPWNEFLLEHYVTNYSRKFKLLHRGFNAGTPVGAIVKRSSRYNDFDELVVTELSNSQIPLYREDALQYLVDIGLLARKNYGGIEQTLSKAKLQRARKG